MAFVCGRLPAATAGVQVNRKRMIKCDATPSKRQRPVASKVKQRVLPPRRPGQPPREIPALEERLAKEQDQLSWLFWPVAIATSYVISMLQLS
jgi:hypothetical protein